MLIFIVLVVIFFIIISLSNDKSESNLKINTKNFKSSEIMFTEDLNSMISKNVEEIINEFGLGNPVLTEMIEIFLIGNKNTSLNNVTNYSLRYNLNKLKVIEIIELTYGAHLKTLLKQW